MKPASFSSVDELELESRFTRDLPGDFNRDFGSRQVEHANFSYVEPTHVKGPRVAAVSDDMAAFLGLSPSSYSGAASQDFAAYFSGNRLLRGSEPYAQCYGGHQFGNWAGQLGDGRAISLGELRDVEGTWQEL